MKDVLKKMLLNGFNPTYSPHSCSIYILQNVGKDKEQFGLSRSDPTLLTESDEEVWVDSALFELDSGSDEETHPIGAFIGFVTEKSKKRRRLYFCRDTCLTYEGKKWWDTIYLYQICLPHL